MLCDFMYSFMRCMPEPLLVRPITILSAGGLMHDISKIVCATTRRADPRNGIFWYWFSNSMRSCW